MCDWFLSLCGCFFFFFKQKTAYEMRISDWSSDVCSSDLFHGIILGYSRQFFALARAGYLPASLAKLSRFQTPHRAIIAGGLIGIAAIYSDGLINLGGMTLTATLITMAVFGALVMYIMSMLHLSKSRKTEPTGRASGGERVRP